jgi:phosphopantothenoylcysteine decarboxylase/phosphopantothenate--cysteine ligase
METNMWRHAATQGHVATLRARGWTVVEPDSGHLASGAIGEGRLAAPEQIVEVVKTVLGSGGDLTGWRVAVTAGGTREPIDPVRFISNRSSGKMGYAVAEAARDRGATVTLITSAALPVPYGVRAVAVERAREMRDAVMTIHSEIDVLVMAAAVADYEPSEAAAEKIKKTGQGLTLELSATPDILAEAAERRGGAASPILVGFAAETSDLLRNARDKLIRKRLDLLVANDVTLENSGFTSDFNKVTILRRDGGEADLPHMPKIEVAHFIWDEVLEGTGRR